MGEPVLTPKENLLVFVLARTWGRHAKSLTNVPVIPVGMVELVLMELITTDVLVLHRILESSAKKQMSVTRILVKTAGHV